jgi:hypothetical protein
MLQLVDNSKTIQEKNPSSKELAIHKEANTQLPITLGYKHYSLDHTFESRVRNILLSMSICCGKSHLDSRLVRANV